LGKRRRIKLKRKRRRERTNFRRNQMRPSTMDTIVEFELRVQLEWKLS